jgi:hypothetical protein
VLLHVSPTSSVEGDNVARAIDESSAVQRDPGWSLKSRSLIKHVGHLYVRSQRSSDSGLVLETSPFSRRWRGGSLAWYKPASLLLVFVD